jgi:RND family efflux transporter MFP subunit
MSYRTVRRYRQTRGAGVWGMLCAALLLSAACERQPGYTPPPPPKVTVNQPVRQNVTDYLELTGNIQSVNTVQLRARVEGYLEKILFQDGQTVKKDQLLFIIQQNTYSAKLQQAEGNVLAQKAGLDRGEIELTRYSNLYTQRASAQTDVDNWRYQRDSAKGTLLTAEGQRDLAKLDYGYTAVTAPFTGRIDRHLVDPGNLVGSGESTVLAQLVQMDPLYVYFTVSETDLFPVLTRPGETLGREGTPKYPLYVGLANEQGYPHEGCLDFASPSINTTTGTLLVRGVLPNVDGTILPGQFARVKLPVGKERSVLLVPRVAVGNDELGSYVLVVNEQNVVERRGVKTGAPHDSLYVVEDGLAGKEWVVVKGLLKAIPGRPVTPEREEPGKLQPETDSAQRQKLG